jgi:crotonobetainyl-CoA:carnitine CoA-transferase CaiB-like acyl-CoA transferase
MTTNSIARSRLLRLGQQPASVPTVEQNKKGGVSMSGALEGIKVLDVGLLVQGPQAAALLSDMGADVIKVELPNIGDHARWIFVAEDDQRSAYFHAVNRGKRSVTIDLRTPDGVDIFKRLAQDADVVLSNFKPGTMDSWGLGYEALSADNPGLIWAAGSAFGHVGPDADREGADLAAQSAGGLISTIGHDGTPASPVGVTIADHIASQNMASGILAALLARSRSGHGQRVDVSLLGGQIWAQASEYSHFFMTDEVPGRANGGHPLLRGMYGVFETSDGWIGIIGVPPEARDAFFIAMDQPELALDPRYQGLLASREEMQHLFATLTPVFRTRTTNQWCDVLRAMGVRYAPVQDYRQASADPGVWENGYLQKATDADGNPTAIVGAPIMMSQTPLQPAAHAPALGEHTAEVLSSLGYAADQIAVFRKQGVV